MNKRDMVFVGLLLVAGASIWLLFSPVRFFGFSPGVLGTPLLVTAAWLSLYLLSRQPRSDIEAAVSPGEWQVWLDFLLNGTALVYLLGSLPSMPDVPIHDNSVAQALVRNLMILIIAWVVLSKVLSTRWKLRVQRDERDRQIETRAYGAGRMALIVAALSLAVTLGFSPADRLEWATGPVVAHLLIAMVMFGALFESLSAVVSYWKDRSLATDTDALS